MSEAKSVKQSERFIVRLDNVRASFLNVFERDKFGNYSGNFLLTPDHAGIAKLKAAFKKLAAETWGDKADTILKQMIAKDCLCLHDGDLKPYDGYAGMQFVTASGDARPTLLEANKAELVDGEGKLYSGCYVNVSVGLWAQKSRQTPDGPIPNRINAQLRGVQFVRDGERFGGGSPAKVDEFDDVSESPDQESLD